MQPSKQPSMKPPARPASSPADRQAGRSAGQVRPSGATNSHSGRVPAAGNRSQSQSSQVRKPATKQSKKKQPVNRLGQAVVSLICGIFGILLFLNSLSKFQLASTYYYYDPMPMAMFTMMVSFIVNLLGFVLGIRARRSISGRGMAIAGITLTAVPVVLMSLLILFVIATMFIINGVKVN